MVSSLHYRSLQVLAPDLSSPVTHRQEVFSMPRVPLESIDWSVMLTALETKPLSDFNLLLLVCLEDVTLLSAY